jgi:L-aspartate oxidase|tara:strand:- start:9124 stop:10734 length:1611 start_codon:yes stop_codon:yes gene_type:complete
MQHQFDVLVIGSGIAGLSFALKVAAQGHKVAILTKKNRAESNTNYAQGGIAAVTSSSDDFELHVNDTLTAGDGLCDETVVRAIIGEAPERVQELIDLGVEFSQLDDGRVSLHREGGHSKRRILHVKDITGRAIENALLAGIEASRNITLFEHTLAIDLITSRKLALGGFPVSSDAEGVVGLYALNRVSGNVETFSAPAVLLATGGVGQIYPYTTNPAIATGDGLAMAYRAGAEIRNLECIQFHPTALYSPDGSRFLISEAVRGEGAILRNFAGETFMDRYDERKELAPRDIVARAIDSQMKKSGSPHVWLDITHRSEEELKDIFPNIFKACAKQGLNMATDKIPVVPAMHYLCGGVKINLDGATEIPGLYACGEVSCSGLHGANRLASNSLLEAVVLANRAARSIDKHLKTAAPRIKNLPTWVDGDLQDSDERVVIAHNNEELKRAMWDYVGIVRTTKRLRRAQTRIKHLKREIEDYYRNFKVEPSLLELRNLVEIADLIVLSAMQRKESRGLHYTLDYPDKHPSPINTVVRRKQG